MDPTIFCGSPKRSVMRFRVSTQPMDTQHVLINLSNRKDFPNNLNPFPQGGLMGLALHPDFMTGKPYVYLAYVYHFDSCAADNHGCYSAPNFPVLPTMPRAIV